jgi:cytidylate kinase
MDQARGGGESPRHGFRGEGAALPPAEVPPAPCVTLSREAGARGGTIGRRVARRLGWQVYDRELLEYLAQDAVMRQGLLDGLAPAALAWVEARLEELLRAQQVSQHPAIVNLARVVLGLGAQGRAVLVGRGAGCILPRSGTLNVRVVAPLPERIAYLGQWLRLPAEEAAEMVRQRDERRAEFLAVHFHRRPDEVHQYDLVLNSGPLGEDLCADLIIRAVQAREGRLAGLAPPGVTL